MVWRALTVVAVLVVSVALFSSGAAASRGGNGPTAAGSYIVVFRDSVDSNAKIDQLEQSGSFKSDFRYSSALQGFAAYLSASVLASLRSDPDVAFVSENRTVHAIGSVPLAPGDSAPPGIRRVGAATATEARQASTVNVAVIDTGINLTHPDLNAVSGKNCIRTTSTANDDNGHGSHVAGTIAAKNQGSGVVGVAPGTKLYAVKVLDASGSGTWAQVICGIDWVTANTAAFSIKVASMSLGGVGTSDNNCGNTNADALHQAICRSTAAGVTYVVAAGNDGGDLDGHVPASYPEALTVTAMTDTDGLPGGVGPAPTCRPATDDTFADFSNFATTPAAQNHTIAAPGVCVLSTWLSGGYNTISGTSMATPHVSGVAALCFGEAGLSGPCTGLTSAQVVQKLRDDAFKHATASNGFVGDPFTPVSGRYYGYLATATPVGSAPADFSLAATPASQSVVQGASTTYTVNITRTGGFTGAVTLSVAGLPAGATGTFSPNPSTSTSSTLTVTTAATTPVGSSSLTITGVSGALTHTATATLVVTTASAADFTISATPASRSITQGQSTTYTIAITRTGGFTNAVGFTVSGLGAGATASFNPISTTGNTSTLTITTTASAATGTFALTITGTSGSMIRNASVTLVVAAGCTNGNCQN